MRWPTDRTLRKINWALYAVIVACGLYVLITPFWPQASFRISNIFNPPKQTIDVTQVDRSKNQLYIPSIKLTEPLLEGLSPQTVNRGVWRIPDGSVPNRGSNTIFAGHRFSYKNPSVFYHLDKVKEGDNIYVSWKKKVYLYKVDKIHIVKPAQTEIGDPTSDSQLTIYTCTPLWSTSHRLVVESKLEKIL